MFKIFVCLCVAFATFESVVAQGVTNPVSASETSVSYVVQLTEYRLDQPISPSLSSAEILAILLANGNGPKVKMVETIRLSTASGVESMAQFGRTVFVTIGTTAMSVGGPVPSISSKNVQAIEIGTTVKVTVGPQNEKIAMTLSFESSSLGESDDADVPPNINKTKVNSTQILELGKPSLVGGSTTSSSSIIVAVVNQN